MQLPAIAKSETLIKSYRSITEHKLGINILNKFFIRNFKNTLKEEGKQNTRELFYNYNQLSKKPEFKKALKDLLFDLRTTNFEMIIDKLKTKSLILWPKKDPLFNFKWGKMLNSKLKHSTLKSENTPDHSIVHMKSVNDIANNIINFI